MTCSPLIHSSIQQCPISHWVCRLSTAVLRSLTQWDWIVDALYVASI
ncbi:hypothetical protein [Parathermosynechococcus lividus]